MPDSHSYDVIVVGAGHAGCEAALAAARTGCRTAVFTLNLDTVALMPCNPSVGGPGKGPAVWALRAQCDKKAYSQAMTLTLEEQEGLDVKQAAIDDLLIETDGGAPAVGGVVTAEGTVYRVRAVVLTTGTFLKGRIIVGERCYPAGRAGEFPADNLSTSLARAGLTLGRLKTGTPPRIDAASIDYSLTA